jgi:putative transposase
MPRLPRINIPGITFHVVQRGNDRHRTFFADDDYRSYLLSLRRISRRYETRVHAYALMSNHVHLLMTADRADGISLTMQLLGSTYTRRINNAHGRSGTLWEGRFKSSPIDSDFYCLACYRYIELNPVRAGLVAHPADYQWSSHRENSGARALSIVEPHDSYLALSSNDKARFTCYRQLFDEQLPAAALSEFRTATSSGTPIGSDQFRQQIQDLSGVPVGPGLRGSPRKGRTRHERQFQHRGTRKER